MFGLALTSMVNANQNLRLSPRGWCVAHISGSSVLLPRNSNCRRQILKQPLRLREPAKLSGRFKATDSDSPDWSRSSEQEAGGDGGDQEASTSDRTDPQITSSLTPQGLLYTVWCLFKGNLWTVVAIYAACDAVVFLLHRLSHRLTNQAAITFLRGSITRGSIGNLWWLSNNPEVATFASGYQWLVLSAFALTFPLSTLLRTLATSAAIISCREEAGTQSPTWLPRPRSILSQLLRAQRLLQGSAMRLWEVALQLAVQTLPLQALCLLVLPLPWALPRLLKLQLALPIAVVNGEHWEFAVEQSRQRLQPRLVLAALLWPYLALLALGKAAIFGSKLALASIPVRVWRDVPEVPGILYVCAFCATIAFARLQDLLPLALYEELEGKRVRSA